MSIPFSVVEEIFLIDTETFFVMWKYNLAQFGLITDAERQQSVEAQKWFNRSTLPGMLITEKEEV